MNPEITKMWPLGVKFDYSRCPIIKKDWDTEKYPFMKPTQTWPGTEERMKVLQQRWEQFQILHVKGDVRLNVRAQDHPLQDLPIVKEGTQKNFDSEGGDGNKKADYE